ncbi:MAG: nidogen-like domain-containing protein [Acidimicrobiia bacterium]
MGAIVTPAISLVTASPASAAANAVILTSASPGTSTSTINNYVSVSFPANDDGTWPCGGSGNASPACPGPDGESGPTLYPIGFNINFFGAEFNSAYINNNGNITFSEPLPEYTPSDLTTFGSPIIAPFFADVDTRGTSSALVNFGTGTLNGQKVFVVNWPGVGCYDSISSVLDDFQLILIDRPDRGTSTLGDDFDMEFNYNSMQWDTGTASSGDSSCQNATTAGDSAFVGYGNGTTTAGDSFNLPGSGVANSFLDSNSTTGLIYNDLNSTTLGRYLFTVNNGAPTQPTSLSTSLSGAGQIGTTISVPPNTAVTDTATLTGTNASTATGTVTYNVYSDSNCASLLNAGTPETITTPGALPSSAPLSLSTAGTYYWQTVYSGDGTNNGSNSSCGVGAEVETVTGPSSPIALPTQLTTSLSGADQNGAAISVLTNTAVTDTATLTGTNASTATGTVTYNVYSDSNCATLVDAGTPEPITMPGVLPSSAPVSLSTAGTYYWQVVYSGDTGNAPSMSACGAEVECVICPSTTSTTTTTVDPPPTITATSTTTSTTTTIPITPGCKTDGGYVHALAGYNSKNPCDPRCNTNGGLAQPGTSAGHGACKHQRSTPTTTVPKCKPGYKLTHSKGRDVCTAVKARSTVRKIHATLISATHTVTSHGPFAFLLAVFIAAIGLVLPGRRRLDPRQPS